MNEKLLEAVLELVDAGVDRDFVWRGADDVVEERAINMLVVVLGILGEDPNPKIRAWTQAQHDKVDRSREAAMRAA